MKGLKNLVLISKINFDQLQQNLHQITGLVHFCSVLIINLECIFILQKKDKRVTEHWKLLIKGLLIRERLKKRFDLQSEVIKNCINW